MLTLTPCMAKCGAQGPCCCSNISCDVVVCCSGLVHGLSSLHHLGREKEGGRGWGATYGCCFKLGTMWRVTLISKLLLAKSPHDRHVTFTQMEAAAN